MDTLPNGVVLLDDPKWNWQGAKKRKRSLTTNLNEAISKSVKDGGFWEKGFFTCPSSVSDEKVKELGDKLCRRFGNLLEEAGYTVHVVAGPFLDLRPLPVPSDQRKYLIWAFISCRPFVPIYDIPEKDVPAMQKLGLRLLE